MIDRELVMAKLHYNPESGVFTWKKGNGRAAVGSAVITGCDST